MIELPVYALVLMFLYMYWSGIVAINIFAPNLSQEDRNWIPFWPIMIIVWVVIKICQFFEL